MIMTCVNTTRRSCIEAHSDFLPSYFYLPTPVLSGSGVRVIPGNGKSQHKLPWLYVVSIIITLILFKSSCKITLRTYELYEKMIKESHRYLCISEIVV